MRTRSKSRSETVDRAASGKTTNGAEKRKRMDDDSELGDAGDRRKRSKVRFCTDTRQSMASHVKERRRCAGPGKAVEVPSASTASKNFDDEAMTLQKFVGALALRRRGAVERSSLKSTGEKSRSSLKNTVAQKQSKKGSPARKQGHSCDSTPSLDDHHGSGNENSSEEGLMKHCCYRNESLVKTQYTTNRPLLRSGDKHRGRESLTPTQGGPLEQCHSGCGMNVHTLGASTQYGEDELQIVDTPLSPQEFTSVHCQSHDDSHHHVVDPTLSQGKTDYGLRSRLKEKDSLSGSLEGSTQGEQNVSHSILPVRPLGEQPLSFPSSDKGKCCPGNLKQFKNQRKESIGSMPTEVSQQKKICFSRKRLNAAKSRWKNIAHSILSAKNYPEILASASKDLVAGQILSSGSALVKDHLHRLTDSPDVGEQIRPVVNNRTYKNRSLPKKQRKPFAAANASAAAQRPFTARMRQKICKQQLSLLKQMKTWLTEANFAQSSKEESSNDIGEEFIMTEDERHTFAQTMVQSCQKNPKMRTVFLESVRMLASSGLMQAAASKLVQQGPCEEAQNVMNAWTDFKERSAITKTSPLNLFNAVDQLHGKRGDLSTKLNMPNVVGICTFSQIDETTWKFQLPGLPLEDQNSLSASGTKSLGEQNATV